MKSQSEEPPISPSEDPTLKFQFQKRKVLIAAAAVAVALLVLVLFALLPGPKRSPTADREPEPYSLDVLSQQKRWVTGIEGDIDTVRKQVARLRRDLDTTNTLISHVRDDLLKNIEQIQGLPPAAERGGPTFFQPEARRGAAPPVIEYVTMPPMVVDGVYIQGGKTPVVVRTGFFELVREENPEKNVGEEGSTK